MKGKDWFNLTAINATIPLYKCPSLPTPTYSPDIVYIFANTFHLSSKYSHDKRSLFHNIPVDTRLRFNVYKTSIRRCRHRIDVQTLKPCRVSTGVLFTFLTHQRHHVEFCLTMAIVALGIFPKTAYTFGVTYNVNVKHTKSLILNMVVSLVVYKSFFD